MKLLLNLSQAALLTAISTTHAQTFDVDEADSLDFESFHAQPKTNSPASKKRPHSTTAEQPTNPTDIKPLPHIQLSQRYSLSNNGNTHQSIHAAINALYLQMAQHCPSGWNKLREWSTPIDKDYDLYYEIECH